MMAAKNLRLHTDTIFDGLLSDGFFVGLLILLFLAVLLLVDPHTAQTTLDSIRKAVISTFDSYLMWTANIIVVFIV